MKNSEELEWTHACEACLKHELILSPKPTFAELESDEMLMLVGTSDRATFLIGLEDVLRLDFGDLWAPPSGCRPEKGDLFGSSCASLLPLSDWTPFWTPVDEFLGSWWQKFSGFLWHGYARRTYPHVGVREYVFLFLLVVSKSI